VRIGAENDGRPHGQTTRQSSGEALTQSRIPANPATEGASQYKTTEILFIFHKSHFQQTRL